MSVLNMQHIENVLQNKSAFTGKDFKRSVSFDSGDDLKQSLLQASNRVLFVLKKVYNDWLNDRNVTILLVRLANYSKKQDWSNKSQADKGFESIIVPLIEALRDNAEALNGRFGIESLIKHYLQLYQGLDLRPLLGEDQAPDHIPAARLPVVIFPDMDENKVRELAINPDFLLDITLLSDQELKNLLPEIISADLVTITRKSLDLSHINILQGLSAPLSTDIDLSGAEFIKWLIADQAENIDKRSDTVINFQWTYIDIIKSSPLDLSPKGHQSSGSVPCFQVSLP